MKLYATEKIRNVGFFGHTSSGKSMLAESMLYTTGAIGRMGRTENENTVMDYDPEEKKRKISINLSLAAIEHAGCKINVLDTPGYDELIGEVVKAISACDAAVITVSCDAGVEVGTIRVWENLENARKPRMFFVNRLDKENADFAKTYLTIKDQLTLKAMPLQIPIGVGPNFKGIVDLIKMKAYYFLDEEGKKVEEKPIPADMADQVKEYRDLMIEAVAEADDELTLKYLDGAELTDAEIQRGMLAGIKKAIVFPMLCGVAIHCVGTKMLLDAIVNYLPSPADLEPVKCKIGNAEGVVKYSTSEPFCGYSFKISNEGHLGDLIYLRIVSGKITTGMDVRNTTTDNTDRIGKVNTSIGNTLHEIPEGVAGDVVVLVKLKSTTQNQTLSDSGRQVLFPPIEFPKALLTLCAMPKSKADSDKLSTALNRVAQEDPTFHVTVSPEFSQTLVSGMGESHLDMMVERMRRKFNAECTLIKPKIAFRETIRKKASAQGRHKKQTGGRGQFGDCWLELNPNPGQGFEYIDKVVGGVVPRNFIPAVEKGVVETMKFGVIAGYPVIDCTATIYDGSYHDVDSSEMAFKIAGRLAFKAAFEKADPLLLEPINTIEVTVPDDFLGSVMGDLSSRRGRIMGQDQKGKYLTIKATVPESEMFKYVTTLKSMTQGRGYFIAAFDHYEEVPANLAQQLKDEYAKEKKDEE